eukprot:11605551-Alexandrium_andersonii.AAC.1
MLAIIIIVIRLPGGAPLPPLTTPRSASGTPANPLRRRIRHLREQPSRVHPSGASGPDIWSFLDPR